MGGSGSMAPRGEPDLVRRRDLLKAGATALAVAGSGRRPPASPRPEHRAGSVILLLMVGGASPWETFDPQPDAPSRSRGPFGSIATAVPGVRVVEHLPEVARRMGRLALIRSIHHDAAPTHDAGLRLLLTGRAEPGTASLGAVAARTLGVRGGCPPFVVVPGEVAADDGPTPPATGAGATSWADAPFVVGASAGSPGYDPARLEARARRWVALASARGFAGAEGGRTPPDATTWDWDGERRSVRDGYGGSGFGRDCWLAGRLVAAGARLVVVPMARSVFGRASWDAHGRAPFGTFDDYARDLLPAFDRGFAGLVDDLRARDLIDSTLVVATGEFGRTPWINESGGRDHWPGVWSALVAGGGVAGGRVVGASDRDGRPADRPVAAAELVATMRSALGLADDPRSSARPVDELFA